MNFRFLRVYLFSVVYLSLSFLFSQKAFAASDSLVLQRVTAIKFPADQFTVDHLGNIYLYNSKEIYKLDSLGNLKNKYSQNALGPIDFIDVNNPLKILVFYRDNSTIILLDNTLSPHTSPISLQNQGVEFVHKACISQQEGFWIYDPQKFELSRFNLSLTAIARSGNTFTLTQEDLRPDYMVEIHDKLWINDTLRGFYSFDIQGNFISKIACTHCSLLDALNPYIVYIQNQDLVFFNQFTWEKESYLLPAWGTYVFKNSFLYYWDVKNLTLKKYSLSRRP